MSDKTEPGAAEQNPDTNSSGKPESADIKLDSNKKTDDLQDPGVLDNYGWLDEAIQRIIEYGQDDDRVYINRDEEVLLYSPNKSLVNHISKKIQSCNNIYYSRADAIKLEKFIAMENNAKPTPQRKCLEHRGKCDACQILSKSNNKRQEELINQSWHNIQAIDQGDGTFKIEHKYNYRNDPCVTYAPQNSNIIEAQNHSRYTIRKADRNGSLKLLEEQVSKMVEKNVFVEMNDKDILDLANRPHNFTIYNHVFNSNSSSTPFRMVSNTSAVGSHTTLSTEMMTPEKILNNQTSSLVRFRLYPIGVAADVKSAYHQILVDLQSSYLRLFYWWEDLPSCTRTKIYRQVSQSFGDAGAAIGLEIAIVKFVAENARLNMTKFILEFSRYADNITHSVEHMEEFVALKKDLTDSFKKYNMPLKYVITDIGHDDSVLNNQDRGSEPMERLLGLNWSLLEDSVSATPNYTLHGSARGAQLGPSLLEMTDEEILQAKVSRLTCMRLTAQSYNRLQDILCPLITSIKIITSRSCELASIKELDLDLSTRDPEFVMTVKRFAIKLKKITEIRPFRRCWIPHHHKLHGFATTMDGGAPGAGTVVHSLAVPKAHNENPDVDRNVCGAKSAISKRNVVAHEALSAPMSADALSIVIEPLVYDFADEPMHFYFYSDSTCILSLLNPAIIIKNVLLENCVHSFKEKLMDINSLFPKAVIKVGYIGSLENPADLCSKFFSDPIKAINSQLYREGPKKYGSIESLNEDIVAVMENGNFQFQGIPSRFLTAQSADQCMRCNTNADWCVLVTTRAQQAALDRETGPSDITKTRESETQPASETLSRKETLCKRRVFARIKADLNRPCPRNLMCVHDAFQCSFVLTKTEYCSALNKFFSLRKLFTFCAWLAALDQARNGNGERMSVRDVQKEGFGILIRSSQKHFPQDLDKLGDVNANGVRCMSLRL